MTNHPNRSKKQLQADELAQSLTFMHKHLKPGDTLYTILDHVSASGMSRDIRFVILTTDADGTACAIHPNHAAQTILGYPRAKRGDGLRVGGCGTDMGFHCVYALSRAMFPDGFDCIGAGCPSNDHANGDRNRDPHRHSDGGYALKHKWL